MDAMLKKIAEMNNEDQVKTFKSLESKLGKEMTNVLRERVFYIKLFTDNNFYKAVVNAMGNNLYNELRKEGK